MWVNLVSSYDTDWQKKNPKVFFTDEPRLEWIYRRILSKGVKGEGGGIESQPPPARAIPTFTLYSIKIGSLGQKIPVRVPSEQWHWDPRVAKPLTTQSPRVAPGGFFLMSSRIRTN